MQQPRDARPLIEDSNELVRLIKEREFQQIFKRLAKHVEKIVESACYRHGISIEADIEEILQNTFEDLFQALPDYDGSYPLYTLVWTIAKRRCIDFLRKKGIRDKYSGGSLHRESEDEEDVEIQVEDENTIDPLQRICAERARVEFAQANPQGFYVLYRYVHEGVTLEELADRLNYQYRSLLNLLSRVRKQLIDLCRKHCGTDTCTAVAEE